MGIEDVTSGIRKMLSGWFFSEELEDLTFPQNEDHAPKQKKFAFLDFQLNQQLRRLENVSKRGRRKANNFSMFPVK